MYKQIIIVRKDLSMSHGKMAAQVSHASMAFLTTMIRNNAIINSYEESYAYGAILKIDKDMYEQWIDGEFTKVILQARNKNNLLRAKTMAEEIGMKENEDFFLIRDNCHTELSPEDDDGRTLTCIGFKPMDADLIGQISKKYHLYM